MIYKFSNGNSQVCKVLKNSHEKCRTCTYKLESMLDGQTDRTLVVIYNADVIHSLIKVNYNKNPQRS
jgi:hypothetical protein